MSLIDRDLVQLVLDDVERLPLEEDAVAERHVAPPRSISFADAGLRIDPVQLAARRLNRDQPLAARRRVDAVQVQLSAADVDVVAAERNRLEVAERTARPDRHAVQRLLLRVREVRRVVRHDDVVDERFGDGAEVVLLEHGLGARVVDVGLAAARACDEQPVALELEPGRRPPEASGDESAAVAGPQVAAEDRAAGDGADVERVALDLDPLRAEAGRKLDHLRKRLVLRRRNACRERGRQGGADCDYREGTNHACAPCSSVTRALTVKRLRRDRGTGFGSLSSAPWSRRSTCSTSRSSRGAGTTSPPTCRTPRSRCCIRAPGSRSARTTSRRSSRWS